MEWTKPECEAIALSMEVTAYVNTDDTDTSIELHETAQTEATA